MTRGPVEVPLGRLDPRRLEPYIGAERMAAFLAAADAARDRLGGRSVVNVNSTAQGGGVAEMLHTLLAYARGAGIPTRWLVVEGDQPFFAITKRLHNSLYGSPGDGGDLGEAERRTYEAALAGNGGLVDAVRPGDVWFVHDPQPAGLIPALRRAGALVVWRCHIGRDEPNDHTERGWAFLRPYIEAADAFVFSREAFAPPWLDRARLRVIPPSIDPYTPKNEPLRPERVRSLLAAAGLVAGSADGLTVRPARVVRDGRPPGPETPLVVQISRWDPMKDMGGVLEAFAEHVPIGALVLAGPSVEGISDDPEAAGVFADTVARWQRLDRRTRARIHLAQLAMDDPAENATIVNALQRHAAVVTQKSLAEGFGLTVVEALLKERPVVASAVGGIVDQIVDGESGLLVEDPHDLAGFGAAVARVLAEPELARRLAANGRERAVGNFLADRHLRQYAELVESLLAAA